MLIHHRPNSFNSIQVSLLLRFPSSPPPLLFFLPLPFPPLSFIPSLSPLPLLFSHSALTINHPKQLLEINYDLFSQSASLNSAGILFSVSPGTLKMSLLILGWNFSSSASVNHLCVHVNLQIQPAVTSISETISDNNITSFILSSADTLKTTINMLQFGVVDNSTIAPVGFFLNTSSDGSLNSTITIVLDLPPFNSSFYYDPDISVTLLGGSSGGDGGGNDDLRPLLALIALAIPIGFIFITLLVVGILFLHKWRWRNRTGPTTAAIALEEAGEA